MSRTLSTLRNKVIALVRDGDKIIQEADYIDAINQAVRFYSIVKPQKKIVEQTGDGATYEWELPSDYYPDISSVDPVEYPAGATGERKINKLDIKVGYDIVFKKVSTVDKYYLRLLSATPSTSDKVRYTYTTLHSVTDAANTLPSETAEQSVIYCAASLCCSQLSAHYNQSSDPTIVEDVSDYASKSDRYISLAKHYAELSGLKDTMEKGMIASEIACIIGEYDAPPSWNPEGDFMVHTKNRR